MIANNSFKTFNFLKSLFNKKVPSPQLDKDTNLVDYLQHNQKNVTIDQLLMISLCISHILVALSRENIVHGLIRCKSFLVSPLTRGGHTIRLCELPSKKIDKIKDRFWLSPDHPTLSSDVFAFGTTLWEIFSFGRKPKGFNVDQLLCPSDCPSSVWKLIQKCWSKRHNSRPTPIELYRFLEEIISDCKVDGQSKKSVNSDSSSWIIPLNHLQPVISNNKLETLGQGVYGQVFKAYYPANSTNYVAIKKYNHHMRDSNQILTDCKREFEIMTKVSHPNIIKIIGIVKDPEVMLVMEFVPLGSLETFLRGLSSDHFVFVPFLKYAHDIASGMEYLEKKKIVHRDLACRNILMASTFALKIADFGLSQALSNEESVYVAKTVRHVPALWYAPESITTNPIFTHKTDIWSFGVTLWEIFTLGSQPNYQITNQRDLIDLLITGKRLVKPDRNVPGTNECWPIILCCWNINPSLRPNFTELKNQIDKISAKN